MRSSASLRSVPERSKPSYRSLSPVAIVSTVEALSVRIEAGFPGSSLSAVCAELLVVSREVELLAAWLSRPLIWARALVGVGLAALLAGLLSALFQIHVKLGVNSISELLQVIEAGVNSLVFLGIGLLFLLMIEKRVKRGRALKSLHTLRALAHIVDMHQLKKDPERVSGELPDPAAGPQLSPSELARYLDHCGDMLTLISKLAALHAQKFDDGATLAVVQEVEELAHALVRNIWQKIVIVERVL